MPASTTLAASAAVLSGVTVLACIFYTAQIFNDVNSLYDEIMTDMDGFKVTSLRKTWRLFLFSGQVKHCLGRYQRSRFSEGRH